MSISVGQILSRVHALAPPELAESWDNVGLLIGNPAEPVTRVLTALDASAGVLDQAAACGAELLVAHHPLIFSGLKRLVEDGGTTTLVRRLIRDGRSLIAAHTNLDRAPRGLNTHVAALLGLREAKPLVPSDTRPLLKLVIYVPEDYVDTVRDAVSAAGAGHIGNYSDCTFGTPGTGTFCPLAGTTPFIGTQGTLEKVAEVRLETVVPKARLAAVLGAMQAAHPYEEVAYDLLPLENRWPGAGLGRVGELDAPTTAGGFLARVAATLGVPHPGLIGDPDRPVARVTLCTGAGGDFYDAARRAGADLYLTGEVKHHQALLARQGGPVIIDAGHFATERPAAGLLAEYLAGEFSELTVLVAEESDPILR